MHDILNLGLKAFPCFSRLNILESFYDDDAVFVH